MYCSTVGFFVDAMKTITVAHFCVILHVLSVFGSLKKNIFVYKIYIMNHEVSDFSVSGVLTVGYM